MNIKKAAVLGAGTMGAGIAAHLANAGIPTLLLDIAPRELTPEEDAKGLTLESPKVKNRLVASLFDAAKKLKPAPFMLADNAKLISTRQLFRRHGEAQGLRPRHRGRRRESRDQAQALCRSRKKPQARSRRRDEHKRNSRSDPSPNRSPTISSRILSASTFSIRPDI